jgi:hypothetical protein|tara:strand:- start:550 stop:831 length:282 start_codon:yes stop_codon:yes gene_type:complete
MKSYKELMYEFVNMKIDLKKARKNKIFKTDAKDSEKILFALIRDGFINIAWDVSSKGWEMMTQNSTTGKIQYWHGETPYDTLKIALERLRLKL